MRKFLLSISLLMMVAGAQAVPAKRGIWESLRLADGSVVRAELRGDEHLRYYAAESGECYVLNAQGGFYETADIAALRKDAAERRNAVNGRRMARAKLRGNSGSAAVAGQKKGLLILVEFPDMKFSSENTQTLYNDILNKDNYSSDLGFVGSVRDYFRDQSNGKLLLDFDVVGPVRMPNGYAYYGENTGFAGSDGRPNEMIATACNAVDSQVDFADYDWDGDGEADQVCVLYAGRGEAAGGDKNTIWPHESKLTRYGTRLVLDGVKIDTYACSGELGKDGTIDGIGTFCHEFSHCLGIPDMYDTDGLGNYGMYMWDIMSYGNYNGNSFIPSAYTSYERWVAGWIEPRELTEDTEVSGMKSLEEGGDAYIIYNEGNRNEYYLLENRRKTGWDAAQAGEGLLVVHVDYDETVWNNNLVNTTGGDHQRLTPIAADNSYVASEEDAAGDVFPYNGNNSLTNATVPAAMVYNKNTDGSYFMNKYITGIMRNEGDGTISFSFKVKKENEGPQPDENGDWFYESFNSCTGLGGNDGKWGNSSTGGVVSDFVPDNSGWDAANYMPGKECMKVVNAVKSPLFYFSDGAVLTFKAAPCNGYDCNLTLSTDLGTLSQTAFTMTNGEWTEFRVTLSGSGYTQLTFNADRYFIDEVRVSDPSATGIGQVSISTGKKENRIYSIDGRYVGDSLDALGRGIYIVNGRKVVK